MKNSDFFPKSIFTEEYATDRNILNMVCVGALSEIQHKTHDFGKGNTTDATDNQVV